MAERAGCVPACPMHVIFAQNRATGRSGNNSALKVQDLMNTHRCRDPMDPNVHEQSRVLNRALNTAGANLFSCRLSCRAIVMQLRPLEKWGLDEAQTWMRPLGWDPRSVRQSACCACSTCARARA